MSKTCPHCGAPTVICGTCGKTIALGRGLARSSRRYCSTACRMKAYRRRKKGAQQ